VRARILVQSLRKENVLKIIKKEEKCRELNEKFLERIHQW
jgi:hypothetical protein